MVFPVVGGDGKPTGYEISNSLRFNDGDSPDLDRAVVAGNRDIFTFSTWFKRSTLKSSGEQFLFAGSTDGSNNTEMKLQNDQITFITYDGSSNISYVRGSAKLRDLSAWYHVVYQIDTTQGTAGNRVKIWINGSQVTTLDQNTYQNQNTDTMMNANGGTHRIGADARTAANFFDGYIAETHYLDGTAYDASYFGETDDNGVWIPKEYTGGNYSNNGFYLQFKQTGTSANSSGMGADTSGEDHHYTPANLAATDVTTDTPTNNFATVNPLTETQGVIDFSEGNTEIAGNTTTQGSARSSIQIPPSGKWYIESEFDAIGGSGSNAFGIVTESYTSHSIDSSGARGVKASYSGGAGSRVIQIMNGSSQIGSNINVSAGIIMQLAVDQDNGKAWLGKDDTYYNSSGGTDGNPSTGSNPTFTFTAENFDVLFGVYKGGGGDAIQRQKVNFGNPPFAISSGNSDANGYGNFEYAVPSGFYSLCTKNLAEYG